MLHERLNLTRPLIVLDTETTGLDTATARIVEIGFQIYDSAGLIKTWRSLVDPGVPIPAAVTKIHGITDAMIKSCRVCMTPRDEHDERRIRKEIDDHDYQPQYTFNQLAPNLAKGFTNCDFGEKNVRYDLRILMAEFARAGVPWSYIGARIVDADRLEALGEPRTLSHLYAKHVKQPCTECRLSAQAGCQICGGTGLIPAKLEGAHGVLADVGGTAEVN